MSYFRTRRTSRIHNRGKVTRGGWVLLASLIVLGVTLSPLLSRQIPRFRLGEEEARNYFQKGLVFYNTRRYIAAREFLYKALAIQPHFHLARRYLGDAYYYSGDWNGALEQWEFLDELASGNYPLVRQRSDTLRFFLNRYNHPGEYTFFKSFDSKSAGPGEIRGPVGLASDRDGSFWILSYEKGGLRKFDQNGDEVTSIAGSFMEPLEGPLGLCIDEDRIYVTDYKSDMVRVFDSKGHSLFSFGGPGNGPGLFRGPAGIAIAGDRVLIADTGNGRVQAFHRDGTFSGIFAGENPDYTSPYALLYSDDSLYISDVEQGLVYEFDMDGNRKNVLGEGILSKPRGLSLNGQQLSVADETGKVFFYNLSRASWSELPPVRNDDGKLIQYARPYAVLGGNDGILYVADYAGNRIDMLVPRGLRTSNLDVKLTGVDSASYPEMALFLTVRNRLGRVLTGLKRKNFLIYENDRRIGLIRSDNMEPYNKRLNLILAKENSKTMRENYKEYIPSLLKWVLEPIRVSDRIKVVRIGETVRTVYEGLERREIVSELTGGETTGEPNLGKGIFESVTTLLPEMGPRHILLIVSGKMDGDPFRQYSIRRLGQYASANGIRIHVISFEGEMEEHERRRSASLYRELTEWTGGKYIRAFDESALESFYGEIQSDMDERYILTYRSMKDKNIRGRYMDVRVEVRYLNTPGMGEGGYFVP